jgi:hypothetical protein
MVMRAAVLLLALVMLIPSTSVAQDKATMGISVEILKPMMDDTKFMNSAMFLGYYNVVTEGIRVDAVVPFAFYDPDIAGLDGDSGLGNPFIGVTKYMEGSPLSFSGGVWIPVADEDKFYPMTGELADPTLIGAFCPKTWTIEAGVNYWGADVGTVIPFFGAGPVVTIPTEEADDTEVFIRFGGGVIYPTGDLRIGAGLSGFYWTTAGDVDADEFVFQGIVGGDYNLGAVRPGLTVRIPLSSDYSDAVDMVIGVHLGIPIG